VVVVGTSGYYYREWVGKFYPKGLPPSRWLEFYAQHFNGLELNASFYRPPSENTLKKLAKFPLYYSLKLFKGITHEESLEEELLKPFFQAKEILGEKLITLLAQFPFSFYPKEEKVEFLVNLFKRFKERGITITAELRHPRWEEKLEELGKEGIPVACIRFPAYLRWLRRCVKTEEISYFRLHGKGRLYRGSYAEEELRELAQEIKSSPSQNRLIFFNNTSGGAPENARRLMELLKLNAPE